MCLGKPLLTEGASLFHPELSVGEYLLRCLKKNALSRSNPSQVDVETSQSMSFLELLQLSVRAAIGWRKRGLKSGHTIAVMCKNKADLFPAVVGAIFEGITVMFIIPTSTEAEVQHFLSLVKPQAMLSETCNHHVARQAADPDVLHVVVGGASEEGVLSARAFMAEAGEGQEVAPEEYEAAHVVDWHEHRAFILFSSGTTGLPKAVAYSNYSMLMIASDPMDNWRSVIGERILLTSPLSWISAVWLCFLTMGIGVTRIVGSYTNELDMIRTMEKYRPTSWFLAPPRLLLIADTVRRLSPRPDLSSLRVIISGGGPLTSTCQQQVAETLGVSVQQIYGSTETSLISRDRAPARHGSSGRLALGVQLRIVDVVSGVELTTPGAVGEVRVKNVCCMQLYVGNPEATHKAYDERGFACTGDLGYLDEDGYLFIVDRIKELIKFNSFEMAPAEIESVLLTHPGITECCVVGRPDPRLGDLPTAFVVRQHDSSVTEQDLQELVAGRLSDFKKLRGGVYFVEEIPKSLNGKVDRRSLREKLKNEQECQAKCLKVDADALTRRIRSPASS